MNGGARARERTYIELVVVGTGNIERAILVELLRLIGELGIVGMVAERVLSWSVLRAVLI